MFGLVIVNAIFAGSSCQFYGACKNKQGSWRKKSHVNRINGCGVKIKTTTLLCFEQLRQPKKLFIFKFS
jgi:hypothetical protein